MIYPPEVQEFLEKYDRLLLDSEGIIKLQSADFYKTIDDTDLRVWCICRAIYQLPTVELIEWLKSNFNLDKAIEIGAGNNYLYHHLGIKGIDNYSEQIPAVKLTHELLNQPSTDPPPEVEKLDAIAAIKKYQPETVITSWMTIKGNDTEEVDGGHRYAPDEDEILDTGVTYVFIGNDDIHGDRSIMSKPHKAYYCKEVEFTAGGKLIQDAENPICSGATIWAEVDDFESLVIDGVEASRLMSDKPLELEDYFWQFVDDFKANKDDNYVAIARSLSPRYAADKKALLVMFKELRGKLQQKLDRNKLDLSIDEFDDLTASLIGLGKKRYYSVLKNPRSAMYLTDPVSSCYYVLDLLSI